ncbi:MAG: phosphoethanolamine--lipid A transferase [Geobacteraceae bacterium]|nr:phosphoethanolamine--lipid A transferase [Geobacteraceae bacterium]NTW79968.1 phosphoethanolamine--lipid A transferase [Geobacteraceae bacterium]
MQLKINTYIPRLHTSSTVANLVAAAFLVCFANGPFWHMLTSKLGLATAGHRVFLVVAGLSLWMVFNILCSLFSFRPVYKPILIVLFCTAAAASYFMESYGIVIDKQMITNLLETDISEATEQLSWPLFGHLFLLGVLPSALLLQTRISYRPWRFELVVRGGVVLGSTVLLLALVLTSFKEFVLFGRQNREVRMYINPTYPIYSLIKTVKKNHQDATSEPVKIIGADARKPANSPKSAVVLVVGETARTEEFSLNGYPRMTNPQLGARNVIAFTDVQSCGTDTAESLPCMFFHLGKSKYSRNEAKKYENLLDVLQRTGVQVIWRDNNSGSKGIGDRVRYEDLTNEKDKALCSTGECYDEILLKDLDKLLAQNSGDMLIILHQKGSHGPSYYKRSPNNFKRFLPECTKDNVQDCDRQSIVNAYDNTIVYTDYVLGKLIDLLKTQKYATAMLYVSDHGESLGENNIYLHGLPYAIAPRQQTQVPMIFWASSSFLREKSLDAELLSHNRSDHFSHDNLFHSLLGLFHVTTELYRPELDLFQTARREVRDRP